MPPKKKEQHPLLLRDQDGTPLDLEKVTNDDFFAAIESLMPNGSRGVDKMCPMAKTFALFQLDQYRKLAKEMSHKNDLHSWVDETVQDVDDWFLKKKNPKKASKIEPAVIGDEITPKERGSKRQSSTTQRSGSKSKKSKSSSMNDTTDSKNESTTSDIVLLPRGKTPRKKAEKPIKSSPIAASPVDAPAIDAPPGDEAPVDEAPVDEAAVDEAPVDEEPVDEEPVDKEPADKEPADEAPGYEAVGDEAAGDEAAGDETSINSIPDNAEAAPEPSPRKPQAATKKSTTKADEEIIERARELVAQNKPMRKALSHKILPSDQRIGSGEKSGKKLPITLSGSNLHRSVEKHCKTRSAAHLSSEKKRLITVEGKGAIGSGSKQKIETRGGGILSTLYSFLPTKAPKEKAPTSEQHRKKAEEKLREKELQHKEQLREKEELRKKQIEEKRLEREQKMKRAEEFRRQQEEDARLKAQQREEAAKAKEQQREEAAKMAQLQKLKERQEKRLEEERRRREALEEKKRLEEERQKHEKINNMMKAKAKEMEKSSQKVDFNATYEVENDKSALNSTYTKDEEEKKGNVESYDITPARHELPPEPLKNPENYDINDLNSEEDTDDEDAPRKEVPKWAEGHELRLCLMSQAYKPPDVDCIFEMMDMPELETIFKEKKRRFYKRTSSAQWGKMPSSYKI